MDILLMLGGLFLLFITLPLSIITTIVSAIKKRKILVPVICIPVSFIVGILFLIVGAVISPESDESTTNNEIESVETDNESDPEIAEEPETVEEKEELTDEFTYRDMSVKYLKHEIVVDDIDQTVLVVYYEFTNNSDENKTFDYSFDDTCFQNGVEVETSWWHVNDESKNSGKEIKSGTTITVASSFVLGDSMDDVELEITPWISDKILFEKRLVLE